MLPFPALPREVGIWLVLVVVGELGWASPVTDNSDGSSSTSCTGALSVFNVKGQSPCEISQSISQYCEPTGAFNSTACFCNTISFNIQNACRICGGQDTQSWSDWAKEHGCAFPVERMAIPTPDLPLPRWASNALTTTQQFDATAALQVAAAAQGWSPIQIAAPIISGGCVAIVAFVIFLFYRRRLLRNIYGSSRPLWQEAHLHGKRRCCGLLPGRKKVKKATVDTLWQIDQPGNTMDVPPQQPRSSSRNGDIELFSHSRETSASSLLPDTYSTHSSKRSFHSTSQAGSQSGNGHSSLFHSIMAKISGNSLNRTWYTSGVDKGPEYKKVTVMQEPPPPGFKIDGTGSTPSRANTFVSRVENSDEDQQSHHSLPSVINIGPPSRSNSLSTGSHTGSSSGHSAPSRKFAGGGTQMQSIEEEDERATEYSAFRPTRSDFTLTTSDLRTPITNSSYRMGPPSSQAHSSAYPESDVLPMSSPATSGPRKDPYSS